MWSDSLDEKLTRLGKRVGVYLFAAALAVHVCYLCQYARTPFFWAPELDSLYDDLAARAIAAGHVSHDPFFRAPCYLYFLASIYKLFGHSFWAARLVQATLGSGSVVLLYLLGTRLFRPSIAVIAAAGMVFYGPLVYNDCELHTPGLEVFLDLLLLYLCVCTPLSPRLFYISAGLVMGLSAITRPSILVTIPVIAWWIVKDRRPRWAVGVALFLAGAAVFPGLVTLRNWRVSGDPVFIASQGGINLFLGNRPEADGFTPSTPMRYRFDGEYEDSVSLYGRRAAEDAAGHPLTASEEQSYWVRKSLDWWRADPRAALRLTARKAVLAWTHQEIRNNTAFDFVRRELAPFLWVCIVGFWLAGPLAIAGMALGWREMDRGVRRLTVFVLVYMAGFVPFFMADRYRLPIVPLLLLLASYAVVRIGELIRLRSTRPIVLAAATLLAGVVLVDVDWVRTETPKTWAIDYWSEGNRYVKLGKFTDAETAFRQAIRFDPGNGDIWNGLGEAQYDEGRLADAAESFRRSAMSGPDISRADFNEALCLEQMSDVDGARKLLTVAITLDPGYARARQELGQLGPSR